MTTTTLRPADRLRTLLRAAGIGPRSATVRERPCSTETSLVVTVRSASVSMVAVRAAVSEVEDVRHCPVSGDVLGGGNVFVHVKWDDRTERPLRERFALEAIEASAASKWGFELRGYRFSLTDGELKAWRDGKVVGWAFGYDEAAIRMVSVGVVRDLLDRGEGPSFTWTEEPGDLDGVLVDVARDPGGPELALAVL